VHPRAEPAPVHQQAVAAPSNVSRAGPSEAAVHREEGKPVKSTPTADVAEVSDEERWRARWRRCPPGQALDEAQQRALDYFRETPLSVIRVSPSDSLSLRSSSSPRADLVAKLDFQQSDLRWTGSACNVHGTLWFEVEWRGLRGWVNGLYAQPTTPAYDATERVKSWLPIGRPKSLNQLAEQLRRLAAQYEGGGEADPATWCDVKTVGSALDGPRARIVLFVECGSNDSIAGSQLLVSATEEAQGWSVSSVEQRDVCLRGAEELCI
jgi:hypothetical protein